MPLFTEPGVFLKGNRMKPRHNPHNTSFVLNKCLLYLKVEMMVYALSFGFSFDY